MDASIFLLLSFSLQSILGQPTYEMFPLRFDLIMKRTRHVQYFKFDSFADLPYTITSARMSDYLTSLTSNETTACERDFETIIVGALKHHQWALKVLDAWGKPLPSGLLKGNVFWTGNYDECVQQLYIPANKTFLSQPFETQHCMYQQQYLS